MCRRGLVFTNRLSICALLFLSLNSGCRAPWQRSTTSEPSFDRLLEVEREQTGNSLERDPISSRLRPGMTSANELDTTAPAPVVTASGVESAELGLIDQQPQPENFAEGDGLLERQQAAAQRLATERARQANSQPASNQQASKTQPEPESVSYSLSDSSSDEVLEQFEQNVARLRQREKAEIPSRSQSNLSAVKQALEKQDASAIPIAEAAPIADVPMVSLKRSEQEPASGLTKAKTAEFSQPASTTEPSIQPQHELPELTWQEHINQALVDLADSQDQTTSPELKVNLEKAQRLLSLAVGDIDDAMAPVEGMDTEAQEFLRYSLQAWHDVSDPNGNPVPRKRYSLALHSQRKALQHLAAAADLEVRGATFCTLANGYGDVRPFEKNQFRADQEVLIYCEVDNFVSRHVPAEKGYETHLQGTYEIVDSSGRRVEDQPLPADRHLCSNQRRDYFIVYRLWLPQEIDPGNYEFRLTIEDLNGRKFGHSTLQFEIVP